MFEQRYEMSKMKSQIAYLQSQLCTQQRSTLQGSQGLPSLPNILFFFFLIFTRDHISKDESVTMS